MRRRSTEQWAIEKALLQNSYKMYPAQLLHRYYVLSTAIRHGGRYTNNLSYANELQLLLEVLVKINPSKTNVIFVTPGNIKIEK